MADPGLRALKKSRTRRLIADTAARLFAEQGYEQVAVTDVAREAEVAEQTVYNYFPSKEQLVIDRDQEIRYRLCDLIRSRPSSTTPAAAVRDFVLDSVEQIRSIPREQWRGELGYLAAISPTVHRLALETIERQATAFADAILDSTEVAPEIARLEGIALGAVFQIIISEAGNRTREGQSQAKIADELYPIIAEMVDELDRWFQVSELSTRSRPAPDGSLGRRRSHLREADLLPLNSGVPEGGDDDELVTGPLAGLGELEVERLSGRRNHVAVGQGHLSRERPGGVGDHGDPVVASELDRVRGVDADVGEHLDQLLHRRAVGLPAVDRLCAPWDERDHVRVVHVVQRLPVTRVEEIVTPRHEGEEVLGPTRRILAYGHRLAFLLVGSLLMPRPPSPYPHENASA
jgi:AcrR family transcriptional regulator